MVKKKEVRGLNDRIRDMMGSNRSEQEPPKEMTTTQKKQQKPTRKERHPTLWAEGFEVTTKNGAVHYSSDSSRIVRPLEYRDELGRHFLMDDLSHDQQMSLYEGQAVDHRGYLIKRPKNKSYIEVEGKYSKVLAQVFPYADIGSLRSGIPEIDYSLNIGKVVKIRVYDDYKSYFDNGEERRTRLFGQYERSWYPLSSFTRGYAEQPAIYVPPIR